MKTRISNIICAALVFCIFSPTDNAHAALITIGIEAVVNYVNDVDNLLEGKVDVNDIITGSYTYDTSTLDTNPASDVGEYFHYSQPCGLDWAVGGFVFKTDPNNVKFLMGMTNNHQGQPKDRYGVDSYNNLPLHNGVQIEHIFWQLEDYSGTALSDTNLPTTAPVLSDWDYSELNMWGGVGGTPPCYEKTFTISAEVTSAMLIPEPMSLFLFGLGLLVIRRRKK